MSNIRVWWVQFSRAAVEIGEINYAAAPGTLNELTKRLPGGAYTTFRTYHGRKVLRFSEQIKRLEETSALIDCLISIDESTFREALRIALRDYGNRDELRLRVSLDLEEQPGRMYIAIGPLETPSAEAYECGVRVVTGSMHRENPKAKLTGFISKADVIRQGLPAGVHEVLLVDTNGRLLEGLSSNFFAVKEGQLKTEGEGALSGITRGLVLEEALRWGITVKQSPVTLEEIPSLDEAFITSASRGVLPVRKIDEQVIANGVPGPVTRQLSKRYKKRIREEVAEI